MGRISDTVKYPFDTAITPNDYVIGSDGDSLKATRNYKVSTMLGYLGNMFNLQSQDLYYTYNDVASDDVGSGEVSSNNYQDATISTADVTNLYVSKLTELGALVDTYLNAIATDELTLIVMDLSAPQNYIVFTLTGSSDVNANTINLEGTVSESNGELIPGRSIGLKLTAGGGGGSTDYISNVALSGTSLVFTGTGSAFDSSVDLSAGLVTIGTGQVITGLKAFTAPVTQFNDIATDETRANIYRINTSNNGPVPSGDGSSGYILNGTNNGRRCYGFVKIAIGNGGPFATSDIGWLDFQSISQQRRYEFPDDDGVVLLGNTINPNLSNGLVTQIGRNGGERVRWLPASGSMQVVGQSGAGTVTLEVSPQTVVARGVTPANIDASVEDTVLVTREWVEEQEFSKLQKASVTITDPDFNPSGYADVIATLLPAQGVNTFIDIEKVALKVTDYTSTTENTSFEIRHINSNVWRAGQTGFLTPGTNLDGLFFDNGPSLIRYGASVLPDITNDGLEVRLYRPTSTAESNTGELKFTIWYRVLDTNSDI
jgi:hypothetical protein